MTPIHYEICLEPDLKAFTFIGQVYITIRSQAVSHEVILNTNELEIQSCRLRRENTWLDCSVTVDASRQEVAISFPEGVQGDFTLSVNYAGVINHRYAGLYRSRYDADGRTGYMASTQFQANDARRVFPCVDHPGCKATFDIELIVDQQMMAVANTAVRSIVPLDGGQKQVQFERTPPMPTYLVFMAVGQFDTIQVETGSYPVRVLTAPGKSEYGRFALDMARRSLHFCEAYTGVAYPLGKCDLIAMPDSIGAMENFGAIRHSEENMLVFPGQTSYATRVLIGQVIAHEVSHMWFGNLVTPADWNLLWLSEAFATYFTFVIPDALHPEWQIWDDFAADRMRSGMNRDGLRQTVPIELPLPAPGADPAPTPSSAPIVYNKGAAVLCMLAAYVGEETFRRGLQHYLRRYQFESIPSQHFWQVLAEVAQADLQAFAEAWIYQSGFPLVTALRAADTLQLQQQRFTFSPLASETVWLLPLDLLLYTENGHRQRLFVLLDEATKNIPLPPGTRACKLNHKQRGFYRVRYDAANLTELGKLVAAGQMNGLDSFNLQNDLFAFVLQGTVTVADYLAFVTTHYARETRYLPLLDLVQNLRQLYLLAPDRKRPAISQLGRTLCEQGLDHTQLLPQPGDNHQQVRLRQELLWAAGLFGSVEICQFGQRMFANWGQHKPVPADILPALLKLGAMVHPQALTLLLGRLQSGPLPEAESNLILQALGQLPQQDQLQQALAFNLQRTSKSQRIQMIAAAAANPAATSFMWDWLLAHQEALAELPTGQVARALVQIIPLSGLGREAEVGEFCRRFAASQSLLDDTLTMAQGWLEINSRLYQNERGN